jgi:hypothetical protein
MYKIDADRLFKQVTINYKDQYFEWDTNKLKDNIFEVIGILMRSLNVKVVGSIELVKEPNIFRIHFANKDAINVANGI